MSLNRILSHIALLGIVLQQVCGSVPYEDWDLSALEIRLSEVDAELERLPALAMRSDSGSIGYRSESPKVPDPDRIEWVQVNLPQAQSIDEIILVPVIRRDSQKGFQADGFLAPSMCSQAPTTIRKATSLHLTPQPINYCPARHR